MRQHVDTPIRCRHQTSAMVIRRRPPMPKIVHVTSVHPAMDTRFLKECRGLAAAGYDVVSVVADADGDRQVDGVQVRAVGVPRSRRDRTLRAGWACVRQGLRERADVLHFHDSELLPWAQML